MELDERRRTILDTWLVRALEPQEDQGALYSILIQLAPSSAPGPIDLPPGPERGRALEARFRAEAAPVLEVLSQHRADDVTLLWVSRSVAARASGTAILALCDIAGVKQIQLVRPFNAIANGSRPPGSQE